MDSRNLWCGLHLVKVKFFDFYQITKDRTCFKHHFRVETLTLATVIENHPFIEDV